MSRKKDDAAAQKALALLPNGFADVLPPRAESEAQSIDTLMRTFRDFGYQRIKPPLLEFEDSLLAPGVGERLSSETFRLMDPVSHRMLGVRSDITPQIVRIVSSRLAGELRPLRLTYANDVLRTRGSQMRTERQFTQTGCEIIGGADSPEVDIEICVLAVLGLKALGIGGITIDLNIPNFTARILAGEKQVTREAIEKSVERRDAEALTGKGKAAGKIASAMKAAGQYRNALKVLRKTGFGKDIMGDLSRLEQVCAGVEKGLAELGIDDVAITVDVLEHAGFEYHRGLGFTLFSKKAHGELGRGGRYDVRFGTQDVHEQASGFTLYMDTVGKVVPVQKPGRKILVDQGENWKVLLDLQGQGWITVRGDTRSKTAQKECSHLYRGGKIVEIST